MNKSIKKQLQPKDFKSIELKQSAGILDDYAIRKDVATRTGTITTDPVNDLDIVNKKYVDTHIGPAVDHGTLSGLADDDHTQYGLLAGRTGSQTIHGCSVNDHGHLYFSSDANDNVTMYLSSYDEGGGFEIDATHGIILSAVDGGIYLSCGIESIYLTGVDLVLTLSGDITDGTYAFTVRQAQEAYEHRCPVGSVVMYGKSDAPTGWLLCDGTAYSKTGIYSGLYSVIGTSFGGTATDFNVPNMQLKFPQGCDYGGGATRPVASSGGSTSYTPAGTIRAHPPTGIPAHFAALPAASAYSNHSFTGTRATIEPPFISLNFIIKY